MTINQIYVGDITYIPIREGWLYLATAINPNKGLLLHIDRGSQYASESYRELLKIMGLFKA